MALPHPLRLVGILDPRLVGMFALVASVVFESNHPIEYCTRVRTYTPIFFQNAGKRDEEATEVALIRIPLRFVFRILHPPVATLKPAFVAGIAMLWIIAESPVIHNNPGKSDC